MVLYVVKYDIHPDKVEAYHEWAPNAVRRLLAVPGLIEFRGYRPATGASQVVTTFEFTDFAACFAWYAREEAQTLIAERRTLTINEVSELWGPSLVAPEPIRLGE